MNIVEILNCVDHTLLSVSATEDEIKAACDQAIKHKTASVCIPASFVAAAKEYVKDVIKICTVIGFPNGYSTTATKVFEAADAVKNGADEVDMVINIGWVKDEKWDEILDEIKQIKLAVGDKILKVIIETCLLTTEEKKKLCGLVSMSGADFIKTSTGFSAGGATMEDIKLMKENVAPHLKIKAAGGISTLDDAKEFIKLGASRLGTSRIVKIVENKTDNSAY